MKVGIAKVWGVLAWVVAAANLVFQYLEIPKLFLFQVVVVPVVWIACVLIMLTTNRRPLQQLWWVWPSAAMACYHWFRLAFLGQL